MHTLHLTKTQYLANKDVQDFITWLASKVSNGGFPHHYFDRKRKQNWSCNDIADALAKYHWPFKGVAGTPSAPAGASYSANQAALVALTAQLGTASNDAMMAQACINVFKWGGVTNGNVSWATSNTPGLHGVISSAATQFRQVLAGGACNSLASGLRFNSGTSKVYALLVNGLIIYDSRVAAALGLAVQRWALARKHAPQQIPSELLFPWAPAKGQQNRNPGSPMPRLTHHDQHAWAAIYASIVLGEVQKLHPAMSVRDLEAALFMIGYDLPVTVAAAHTTQATEAGAGHAPPHSTAGAWQQSSTPTKGVEFDWRFDQASDRILTKRGRDPVLLITIRELADVLTQLHQDFGSSPFQLRNSASEQNRLLPGIGRAFKKVTQRSAPHSSRVTAICEDIDALERVAGRNRHEWRIAPWLLETVANEDPAATHAALTEALETASIGE